MSRWFRLYDEMLDDPKMQRLPPATFKAVINLWCLASKNGGRLPEFEDIAFGLRMDRDAAVALLDELVTAGLLDHDDAGLRPHNWDKRQFKSDVSTERVQHHRERHRNVSCNVSETPPDTEQITDTEQKKEETRARRAWPFEEFWSIYPSKIGKGAAEKAFRKVEKSQSVDFPFLLEALRRYVAKKDDRPWCNPSTWLNQRRWEDQPPGESVISLEIPGFHAPADSPQLEAWDQHGLRTKGKRYPRDRLGGWRFPTEWPPDWEEKRECTG
jgi:hypothetical protein